MKLGNFKKTASLSFSVLSKNVCLFFPGCNGCPGFQSHLIYINRSRGNAAWPSLGGNRLCRTVRRWGGSGVPSLGGMWLFDSQCPISHNSVAQKVMDCWACLIWVMKVWEWREGLKATCEDCGVGALLCRANLCTPVGSTHTLTLGFIWESTPPGVFLL